MAKDFLKKNSFEYEEYNVAEDDMRREEMLKNTGQMGVPVIVIDGEYIVGFNKQMLATRLNIII